MNSSAPGHCIYREAFFDSEAACYCSIDWKLGLYLEPETRISMNLFEGVTVLVVVGLVLCSAVHSQSCDVRECPPRRMCVEEEVCRVNRKGREICRTSVRCEIVKGPRPQSDCSLVQCASKFYDIGVQ